MISSAGKNWTVFSLLTVLTVGCAAAWLSTVELIDDNIRLTVRHSVQFAYPFLLLVLLARPLQQLLKKPWTATLLKNRRFLGIAFAGVMTGHLLLIIFRFRFSPELDYPVSKLILGGSCYALIYLMFITSFNGPARALGPKLWKRLHRTGLVFAILIFAVPRSIADFTDFEYLKLGIPMLLVLIIRFTAWQQSSPQGN